LPSVLFLSEAELYDSFMMAMSQKASYAIYVAKQLGSISSTFYPKLFLHADPKFAKKAVKSAVSFCIFGTYMHKNCTSNVDEMDLSCSWKSFETAKLSYFCLFLKHTFFSLLAFVRKWSNLENLDIFVEVFKQKLHNDNEFILHSDFFGFFSIICKYMYFVT